MKKLNLTTSNFVPRKPYDKERGLYCISLLTQAARNKSASVPTPEPESSEEPTLTTKETLTPTVTPSVTVDPNPPTANTNPPTSQVTIEETLFGEILNEDTSNFLIPKDPDEETGPKDQIPHNTTKEIVEGFAKHYKVPQNVALMAITRLVQDGGTNSSKPNLKRNVRGVTFDLEELRRQIQIHTKTGTVRKLAKTIRNVIAHISLINQYPGPLYRDLLRTEPTLQINSNDAVFCNEIHSDNYDVMVPPQVREALQRRETRLREQRLLAGQAKPNRKGGKKKKKK